MYRVAVRARPLESYLLHLGLYDSTSDARGGLACHATPLVERLHGHMAEPMPEAGGPAMQAFPLPAQLPAG